MAQGRDYHPRSLFGSHPRRDWHVCRDCLMPLARELDGIKELWCRPPLDVLDDEKEDHFEVYDRHVQHCLSLLAVESEFRRFDFDRAILWMKANQRELLARETEAGKADLFEEFGKPIPNDIDGRNARAQVLADFAWHLWRVAETLNENTPKAVETEGVGPLQSPVTTGRRLAEAIENPGPSADEQAGPAKPTTSKPKRSTERGEGREKLISALTKHHDYANGSCLNPEPIGNNELARQADVDPSTASAFFNREFNNRQKKGHAKYKVICRDPGRLADSLKAINGEFSPHDLYGRRPYSENDRDDDE